MIEILTWYGDHPVLGLGTIGIIGSLIFLNTLAKQQAKVPPKEEPKK